MGFIGVAGDFDGNGSNLSNVMDQSLLQKEAIVAPPGLGDMKAYAWRDKNGNVVGYVMQFWDAIPTHLINPQNPGSGRTPSVVAMFIDDLSAVFTTGVVNPADFDASVSAVTIQQNYNYLTSLLNGDINVVIKPGIADSDIEVGSGGSAVVVDSAASNLYLWNAKNVVWTNSGPASGNTLSFEPKSGNLAQAPDELILNLKTGLGANPWGGTLQVSNVDNVNAYDPQGAYIVANDDGDKIDDTFDNGNALIVGGAGNDTLTASFEPVTTVLVAGAGTNTLKGPGFPAQSSATTVIYVYGLGVDTISSFTSGNSVGIIDVSAVPGINAYSDLQPLISQSGSNTLINFGGGRTITLLNVLPGSLSAANFLFRPTAATILTAGGDFHAGQTVQITLAMTGVVTVAGGAPTLTLSNNAIATYDAAASSAAGHILVFDYTVGAGDGPTDLAITAVNPNGSTITDANGHSADFSRVLNHPTGIEINPATVTGITPSSTGEVDSGQHLKLTLTFSQTITLDQTNGNPKLTLSDGATALFDHATANQLVFDYAVGASDHSANLQVTGVNLNGSTLTDAHGLTPDFSAALNVNSGTQIGPAFYSAPLWYVPGEIDAGQTAVLGLLLNKSITLVGGTPSLTLSDGATAAYDAAKSNLAGGVLAFDYSVGAGDHSPSLSITAVNNAAGITDGSGNAANLAAVLNVPISIQVGSSPLHVTSISSPQAGQQVNGQNTFTIVVQMSESFTGGGSASLRLNFDGEIAFETSSDPAAGTLTFQYEAIGGDLSDNATVVAVNTFGTIEDNNGYLADFSGAVGVPLNVGVQTAVDPLVVTSVISDAASPQLLVGQTLHITLTMSEGSLTLNTSGGSPTLTLDDGAVATYDSSASNLSAGKLVFDYQIGANDRDRALWVRSADLNGATLKDSGQHNADLAYASAAFIGVQVGPAIVASVATPLIGTYRITNILKIDVNLDSSITVNTSGGSPTISLSDGGTGIYDASSSSPETGVLTFDYTILAGQRASNLEITRLDLNGSTITDSLGTTPDFTLALNAPTDLRIAGGTPLATDFLGNSVSDILFRDSGSGDTGLYKIANGVNVGWNDIGASSTAYSIVGAGDFNGDDTSDILYRSNTSGDTGFYAIVNGALQGWHDIGASSTAYAVVGVGDFNADNTSDILFRNNASGDTGYYQIVNGANTGWHAISASSTVYSVVGVGDFNGDGTSDILFRNNSGAGDTGFYSIVNGALAGWHDIGASSTAYSVVGVGDFNGDGTSDILYRNNNTGDTGFYAIANGVNTGWHDIGPSSTAYGVVATGDYNGDGTSDILFRDSATGDTGFYAIVNGVNTGWHDIGASSTAYHVVG